MGAPAKLARGPDLGERVEDTPTVHHSGFSKTSPVQLATGGKGSSDARSLRFHVWSLICTEKLSIYLKIILRLLQKNHYKGIRTKLL